MRTLSIVLLVGLASLAAGRERPSLQDHAAPSATDLLRAELLAERAARKLRMPKRSGSGWRHGGSGWGRDAGPAPDPGAVRIDIHPPRRRR